MSEAIDIQPLTPGRRSDLEGFPVDADGRVDPAAGYHGFASTFAEAGFEEVVRRSQGRPYMRRRIG
jgi:hypothetical protein